jgi:hypothetical protein
MEMPVRGDGGNQERLGDTEEVHLRAQSEEQSREGWVEASPASMAS